MSNQLYSEIAKNTKGENILLIGSSGNIGGRALEILLKYGKASSITAFDKKEPKMKGLPESVKVLSGDAADITRPDAVKNGVKGNTVVVCAIGVPRYTMPGEKKLTPYEIEQDGMQHIVKAAQEDAVNHIIYISALGVARGDNIPEFHHAHIAKRNAENILIKSGIDYTILRPSGYFFDFRDLLAAAVAGRYHVVEEGKARVQPLHQDDMATILIASINNKRTKNKIIPLGGAETFNYNDLGKLFGRVLKKEVEIIRLAPEKYKKEYFNSDVILFRATSDSILSKKELDNIKAIYPGLTFMKLEDYLDNPDDPMLKTFFQETR
ncbi:MAG: hypothetical protein AMJ42_04460 [Deltaproteobacteria bacterium DG_8]|nr:MAG: hypothetical protein AMJ42_04460 [Deltaproteobacteria bacterium DG_8]